MARVMIDGVLYVPEKNTKAKKKQFRSLGDAMKKGRENLGLSLGRAADRAGISRSHLLTIEKDEAEPSLWIASRLARLYGLDLNILGDLSRFDFD